MDGDLQTADISFSGYIFNILIQNSSEIHFCVSVYGMSYLFSLRDQQLFWYHLLNSLSFLH